MVCDIVKFLLRVFLKQLTLNWITTLLFWTNNTMSEQIQIRNFWLFPDRLTSPMFYISTANSVLTLLKGQWLDLRNYKPNQLIWAFWLQTVDAYINFGSKHVRYNFTLFRMLNWLLQLIKGYREWFLLSTLSIA